MFREDFYNLASTLPQGFQILRERLEITGLQASIVSTRQQNVRAAVERRMNVRDSFLTGSYMRNTMIAPLQEADVDIFIVLSDEYFRTGGQAYILDKVRAVLLETYSRTPNISRDGQAVTITFTDFKVDVVPAFTRPGGGFLIPNTIQNEWVATDPRKHITIWSDANRAHNGDLVPLIKMIKGWNKQNGDQFYSFHLECLILQVLNNVTISSFPSGVRYVFDKARSAVRQFIADPAGYANVGRYLDTQEKINAVVNRLESAYTRAVKAEECAARGNMKDAYDYWQLVFGSYFPAYG
jgi:hypothetical protein